MTSYGIQVLQNGLMQNLDSHKYIRALMRVYLDIRKENGRAELTLPHRLQGDYVLIPKALSNLKAFPPYVYGLHKKKVYYKVSDNIFEASFDRISDKWIELPSYQDEQLTPLEGILIAYE